MRLYEVQIQDAANHIHTYGRESPPHDTRGDILCIHISARKTAASSFLLSIVMVPGLRKRIRMIRKKDKEMLRRWKGDERDPLFLIGRFLLFAGPSELRPRYREDKDFVYGGRGRFLWVKVDCI